MLGVEFVHECDEMIIDLTGSFFRSSFVRLEAEYRYF